MNLDGWAISTELFTWMLENIPKNSTILELGSGTGTEQLVKHYNVYSVEHDKKWLGLVPETHYIYAPLQNNWYDVGILKQYLPTHYDVLLIDGPPNTKRAGIINHLDLFNTDIPIIVDDTHRELDLLIVKKLTESVSKKTIEIDSGDKKTTILLPIL